MVNLRLDFVDRISQIDKYLALIWVCNSKRKIINLEDISEEKININDDNTLNLKDYLNVDNDIFQIDNTLIKVLKSNTILLLYNLVEGTINTLMNHFFFTLNSNSKRYEELKPEIRKIWIKYKHKSFSTNTTKKNEYIVNTIDEILNEIFIVEPKTIKDFELGGKEIYDYDAYLAETKTSEISGNLDTRKIKSLFTLYGFPTLERNCNSMLKVKNKRNSLAHGDETFAQVGNDLTVEDLFKIKKEIKDFLEYLLDEMKIYFDNERYLK